MRFRLILGLTALVISLGTAKESHAAIMTVPNVPAGTQYRLVFVTSGTRNATSSNIADYNSFVHAQANLSPELASLNTTWTAIGSTLTIDARDNTSTNPNAAVGVAFYQLDGLLVASNNADLWDGLISASINRNQLGLATSAAVWTGTHHTGVVSLNPLGDSDVPPFSQFGATAAIGPSWVNFGSSNINDGVGDLAPLYAISGVLTAPGLAPVPEPSSLVITSILSCLAGIGWVHRRQKRPAVAV